MNLYTSDDRRYIDFIFGIGVMNIGHGHLKVQAAIQAQMQKHLHVMVYDEYVLLPRWKDRWTWRASTKTRQRRPVMIATMIGKITNPRLTPGSPYKTNGAQKKGC
ncbi:MAG: aminotransferase class III-fold pyridoxal phosphate-dependent enzyme [bacterium]